MEEKKEENKKKTGQKKASTGTKKSTKSTTKKTTPKKVSSTKSVETVTAKPQKKTAQKTNTAKKTNTTTKKSPAKKTTTSKTATSTKKPTSKTTSKASTAKKSSTTNKTTKKVTGTPVSKKEANKKVASTETKKTPTTKKTTTSKTKTNTVKKKTNTTLDKAKTEIPVKNKTDKVKRKITGNVVTNKKKVEKEKTVESKKEQRMVDVIGEQVKFVSLKIFSLLKKIVQKIILFIKEDNAREKAKKIHKQEVRLEKRNKKSIKRRRIENGLILVSIVVFIIIILNIPLGRAYYKSGASNKRIEVPRLMKLKEECCNFTATFSSFRSVHSLKHDIDKMISQYEVLECDNKTFYYNKKENYTITEYGVRNGKFLNEVYISYGSGNSCDIDTRFKKLELLPNTFSIEEAKKDGNYVMLGDKVYNKSAYDNFMSQMKEGKNTTLRIVTVNKEGDVLITDLEYLKEGKFMVHYDGTRDRYQKDHNSILAYKFEHLKLSKNKLYAYNGDEFKIKDKKPYETYYLLTLPGNE